MRSLLFVPADSERKLARGPTSGADALILDLEDSVMPANRPAARMRARAFLGSTESAGFRRYVRINALASGWRSMISPRSCQESLMEFCCRNARPRISAPSIITCASSRRPPHCRSE